MNLDIFYFVPVSYLLAGIFYNSKIVHPEWLKELFVLIWGLEYPTRSEFLKLSLCYFVLIFFLTILLGN